MAAPSKTLSTERMTGTEVSHPPAHQPTDKRRFFSLILCPLCFLCVCVSMVVWFSPIVAGGVDCACALPLSLLPLPATHASLHHPFAVRPLHQDIRTRNTQTKAVSKKQREGEREGGREREGKG